MMKTASKIALLFLSFFSVANAASFDFQALTDKIQNEHINSIEALLPTLPASLRSNFTLIQHSSSRQSSNPEFPRVLMFTPDARLVISFNGNEEESFFDDLEVMEFQEESKSFLYRSISFPSSRNQLTTPQVATCTGCHGQDSRPIFGQYPTWSGAIGEDDDFVDPQSDSDTLKKFKDPVTGNASKGRYASLLFDPSKPESPFRTKAEANLNPIDFQSRPNARLTLALNRLNILRLKNRIDGLLKPEEKNFVAASLLGCQAKPSDVKKLSAEFELNPIQFKKTLSPGFHNDGRHFLDVTTAFLLLKKKGVPTLTWTPDLQASYPDFTDGTVYDYEAPDGDDGSITMNSFLGGLLVSDLTNSSLLGAGEYYPYKLGKSDIEYLNMLDQIIKTPDINQLKSSCRDLLK